MHAEWENWILGETEKCNRMGKMLDERNDTRPIRNRFWDYCSSCKEAGEKAGSNLSGI